MTATELVRPFETLGIDDVPVVGGKNASLGEMYRELSAGGVEVPNGFATTADAYRAFLRHNDIDRRLGEMLQDLDVTDVRQLARVGQEIRDLIVGATLPEDLQREILEAYRTLSEEYGEATTDVAVRSSATAEDLPDASFAGQQETYLNIRGKTSLLEACRKCFASLFTNRAIVYRAEKGFDHLQVALSIGVQKMVRADRASSGVLFTIDTETGFRGVVLITAAYGLGENVVRGVVNPDEYYVFKPTLKEGFRPIIQRKIGTKEVKMVYDSRGGTRTTRNVAVPQQDRLRPALTDDEVLQLARWGVAIEEHYSRRAGQFRPMDVEWAKDGSTGRLFVLQARPETVQAVKDTSVLEVYRLAARGEVMVEGRAVGAKIGRGPARVIRDVHDMEQFGDGEVLVTEMTDPDWVPIMKRAAAIVTERGGRTCHAAIVSRELGIPAVIGADDAMERIAADTPVTVSCAEGETGYVYQGLLDFAVERIPLHDAPRPDTRIMVNVGNPEGVFDLSFMPNDGVGLARMEFIITASIGIHPMALLEYPQLDDADARKIIEARTKGYARKADYFVDRLAEGVAKIAAAFHPKDVILRMSDFKTNEYGDLVGGRAFEPMEDNPMLGFRGASRYVHPRYREGFALECEAVKRVRDEMGLRNLKVMIPFCRTVDEGRRVVQAMAEYGLVRGQDGLEVYVMCEIPSNVVLAHQFAEVFDGFSIGSNDLTQLVLGVDRDSEVIAELFDERNDAVKQMIRNAIEAVHDAGKKIGICGQAPSDYPDFARFLVDCGIDSMSLNPDAVINTRALVAEYEQSARSSSSAERIAPAAVR